MNFYYLRKMIFQGSLGKIISCDGSHTLPSIKYSLRKINPMAAFFGDCYYILNVFQETYIQIFNIHRVNETEAKCNHHRIYKWRGQGNEENIQISLKFHLEKEGKRKVI